MLVWLGAVEGARSPVCSVSCCIPKASTALGTWLVLDIDACLLVQTFISCSSKYSSGPPSTSQPLWVTWRNECLFCQELGAQGPIIGKQELLGNGTGSGLRGLSGASIPIPPFGAERPWKSHLSSLGRRYSPASLPPRLSASSAGMK